MLVRTGGRYPGGSGDRSWLLIKHRDDWAGDLDITEFAPKSVKSGGDFEDILAEDTPAVWQTNRPAKGGESGAMLATIIERAARLKADRQGTASKKKTVKNRTEAVTEQTVADIKAERRRPRRHRRAGVGPRAQSKK